MHPELNDSHFVLVAYAEDGLRQALDTVATLEPLAKVQLCSYEQAIEHSPGEPDAAICVVTDQESIELAHEFQSRLDDVPTVVMEGARGLRIEANGFAGRVSCSPEQVRKTVGRLLDEGDRSDRSESETAPKHTGSSRSARRIATPLDHVLARGSGAGQSPRSILAAVAQQLAWDLRASRVEAFLRSVDDNSLERLELGSRGGADGELPSEEVLRLIKRRQFPTTLDELGGRPLRPLHRYLSARRLNVLVPLSRQQRLFGWLAFQLDDAHRMEEWLDDLEVVAHLLVSSLAAAYEREQSQREATELCAALSAKGIGVMILNREGVISAVSGEKELAGRNPGKDDHYKAIHNSRLREVVDRAMKGDFVETTWRTAGSRTAVFCSSVNLGEGRIAVLWGPQKEVRSAIEQDHVELRVVLESLPVPVVCGRGSRQPMELPAARISLADSAAIRACAKRAHERHAKSLHLRVGSADAIDDAVLFYESPEGEPSAFSEDIEQAVRFSLCR